MFSVSFFPAAIDRSLFYFILSIISIYSLDFHVQVTVAFLDIELFGESGIDLARGLIGFHPHINIIFLTGHSEYTADALRAHTQRLSAPR